MKKLQIITLLLFSLVLPAGLAAQNIAPVRNDTFTYGEKLSFRIFYNSKITGNVPAGIARMQVGNQPATRYNRNTYHVKVTANSTGAFNTFFKVDDRFESFIDEQGIVPWEFIRRTREGRYRKDDEVKFNRFRNQSMSRTRAMDVPADVQDMVSMFYYARTMDASKLSPGESFPMNFMLDDSVYYSKIVYLGRDTIRVGMGTFATLKFKPMVATGTVFKEPYPMLLWISDDKNRLPVLVQSELIVGRGRMELTGFEGVLNPVTSLIAGRKK